MTVAMREVKLTRMRLRVNTKNVMTPSQLTCLLAENMDIPQGSVVADLGCGCGFLGIIAAKLGAKLVYSVDVNPHALRDTRFNASINGVSKIIQPLLCDIRKSNQLLDGKVDVIICNPPQTPLRYQNQKDEWLSIAQNGGTTGRTILNVVISQAPRFFKETSSPRKLEVVITSLLGVRSMFNRLARARFSPSIVASTLVPFKKSPYGRSKKTEFQDLTYKLAVVIHADYVTK